MVSCVPFDEFGERSSMGTQIMATIYESLSMILCLFEISLNLKMLEGIL